MSKENTFYFSHDYNTRSDMKIQRLITKKGYLGYGLFWALIENLYNNANALPLEYDVIAFDLRTDEDTIKSLINDFDLFVIKDGYFGSDSVQRRLEERELKSSKARKSAFDRWNKVKNDANALPTQSDSNAIKESKVKESKVEYKEEEEPLDLPEVPSDVPSNLKLSQVNETTNVKNSKYYKITLGFRDLFLYNCKEFGIKNTKHLTDPDFIKFSNPIRLIIESDGYNVEDLRTVYDYLKNSNNTFWKKQVYSTSGLKEKFNKLIADAHAEQKQAVKTIKKPTLNI